MILTALFAAAALVGTPQPVRVPQRTSEATAEGVEILRRILVEDLDDALQDKDRRDGKVTTLSQSGAHVNSLVRALWIGGQTVQHSRAFHVPDAGLFFSIDAALPLVEKEKAAETEKSDQPTDDEWERTRREVRGRGLADGMFRPLRVASPAAVEIDPAAIEKVIDVVLKTVARHATRIEGLGARETVTVALRLSGRGRTLLQEFGPDHEFRFDMNSGRMDSGEDEESSESEPETYYAYALGTGIDMHEEHLVIRIAVGDLGGFAEGAGSLDTLRKRAVINRY